MPAPEAGMTGPSAPHSTWSHSWTWEPAALHAPPEPSQFHRIWRGFMFARFGLRGRRAVNVIYIGSLLLLLAYVGSRFVLEVVLRRTA